MSSNNQSLAMQRIAKLVDENSFMEIGSLVTARSTDFNLTAAKAPSDGVIIGHGLIDGNLVFIYSQDATVLNGTIGETGGYVHVSLNADHQYFYLKVEDNGIGIPEESLEHIYERFYRVDKSHSREIGGTGLGLAITRSSILMHRGAIKAHSVMGEGTTFDVRIPLNYIV